MVECEDCGESFMMNIRGRKRVPKKLCPPCVLKRIIHKCDNCFSQGCIKDGFYKAECWKCKKNGCIKCIPNSKTVKGIDFDFCKNHSDYPNSKLKFDAEGLLEEEHNLDGGLNGN